MLYTIQWWKKPATGASTSVMVNAKLLVPFGTLDQCSVGAWFFPLQPEPAEPGPPNSELTGSQPSSVKSGLVIVNGWKVAADACAAVPVSEAASSAAPPMIKARSLRYMKSSCRRSMGVTIASCPMLDEPGVHLADVVLAEYAVSLILEEPGLDARDAGGEPAAMRYRDGLVLTTVQQQHRNADPAQIEPPRHEL